jgi:hypothetical protein
MPDLPTKLELRALLPSLSAPERALLDLLMQPHPTWIPLPGPQTEAWLSEADELFYGGSAGGGKSDLLLGLAATAHRKTLILRREYPQLREITDRSRQLFTQRGSYSERTGWRLADGRTIEFGAVQHEPDVSRYQGRAHDLKAFDELPHFTEAQYRFLIGWARTTTPGQRVRIVGAGNPPTSAEGEWVIQRWAAWLDGQHTHPARPGELRWYAMVDGEEIAVEDGTPFLHHGALIKPRSRTFIPARLTDNPYLLATDYEAVLQAMPEPLRSQMLYGDFSAGHDDDPWQVIPTAWVRAAQARWREDAKPSGPLTAVGVDVARGGKDKTVLSPRYGAWFAPLEKHPGSSTPDGPAAAALVFQALTAGGYANIDVIGVGASVFDLCRQQDANANPINFADASSMTDRSGTLRMANKRAEAYWTLREALDPEKGDGLMLPPDRELLADLCAPRWSMRVSGIQVESKEDIVKRLGRSPDCGDAVVLAALSDGGPLLLWGDD